MSRCPLRTAIWRTDSPCCTGRHKEENDRQNAGDERLRSVFCSYVHCWSHYHCSSGITRHTSTQNTCTEVYTCAQRYTHVVHNHMHLVSHLNTHTGSTAILHSSAVTLHIQGNAITLDNYIKRPLVYPHCSAHWHCCHSPAESELPLHGLSVLLSKVECCPTAYEGRETQWNLMGQTYVLVVYCINWCTCGNNIPKQKS